MNRKKGKSGLQAKNKANRAKTKDVGITSEKSESQSVVNSRARNGRITDYGLSKRLCTVFEKEVKEVVEARKKSAQNPICRCLSNAIDFYSEIVDVPKRPYWTYEMTKQTIEQNERQMFTKYLESIYSHYPNSRLNYFEHNLEVWRQLWRVCEISDILMILADVRHPMFHFPPALYHYIVDDLNKPLILVLTKIDLVPIENVTEWLKYFKNAFPAINIAAYCSYQKKASSVALGTKKKKRLKKGYQPTGANNIFEIIRSLNIKKNQKIVPVSYDPPNSQNFELKEKVNQNSFDNEDNMDDDESDKNDSDSEECENSDNEDHENSKQSQKDNFNDYEKKKQVDYIIIGLIGNPNVGKSTFINSMKGNKVCSTSRTPGHTKWKQTIFLNSNLMLVDCPGLVFPAVDMPKQLQILCGLFPISQVREPYSAIGYAAQMVKLEEIYQLNIDDALTKTQYDASKGEIPWSAWMICEAYAIKRGYRTVGGGLNIHRAGSEILYDIIDGKVPLYFLPNQVNSTISVFYNERKLFDPMKYAYQYDGKDVAITEENS